ncbi:MAG: hypothetical protein P794_02265 [Epsilonproteobacteria bacterium (ex Lamellibrachia satsuma)]|nr:MAG: hypothetical protein P794_02265 [Epsilonproteobacteria bacterium (ex Lamellibrachia satsuma)]
MSKIDEKLEQYITASKELNLGLSADIITKVTQDLVPAIYQRDSEIVSCSDSSELDTVKKSFLQKKLGLTLDDAELDAAIKKVCEEMGSSNRNKYRALFYAMLAKECGREDFYA